MPNTNMLSKLQFDRELDRLTHLKEQVATVLRPAVDAYLAFAKEYWTLYQPVEADPGAAEDVFTRFCSMVQRRFGGADVYLTVRESNAWAPVFYERLGLHPIAAVAWKKGALRGLVYKSALGTKA